jgi:uracil-DNA glycosylase
LIRESLKRFEQIQQEVVDCRNCPRLVEWRERVARQKVRRFAGEIYWGRPVPAFGRPDARLLVIGLAPAAHGGNRTGRMFTGDRSGDWLFEALHHSGFANQSYSSSGSDGLQLIDCLVTAPVRCAPPDNKPLPAEMERCRRFLMWELELAIAVKVVIALGRIGFDSFLKALPESRRIDNPKPVFGHGVECTLPGGVTLIASFHPSQQNTLTGRLSREMFHSVFRRARQILSPPPH